MLRFGQMRTLQRIASVLTSIHHDFAPITASLIEMRTKNDRPPR